MFIPRYIVKFYQHFYNIIIFIIAISLISNYKQRGDKPYKCPLASKITPLMGEGERVAFHPAAFLLKTIFHILSNPIK